MEQWNFFIVQSILMNICKEILRQWTSIPTKDGGTSFSFGAFGAYEASELGRIWYSSSDEMAV